jgi:hypothetical protein
MEFRRTSPPEQRLFPSKSAFIILPAAKIIDILPAAMVHWFLQQGVDSLSYRNRFFLMCDR